MRIEWVRGHVECFGLQKSKPQRWGWIGVDGFTTWFIYYSENSTLGFNYILTTSEHSHYSDHFTLDQAKQYAEQGGHPKIQRRSSNEQVQ